MVGKHATGSKICVWREGCVEFSAVFFSIPECVYLFDHTVLKYSIYFCFMVCSFSFLKNVVVVLKCHYFI